MIYCTRCVVTLPDMYTYHKVEPNTVSWLVMGDIGSKVLDTSVPTLDLVVKKMATIRSKRTYNYKFPCGSCSGPVKSNSKGIQYDGCDFWFHAKCVDLTDCDYANLRDDVNVDASWHCPNCVDSSAAESPATANSPGTSLNVTVNSSSAISDSLLIRWVHL